MVVIYYIPPLHIHVLWLAMVCGRCFLIGGWKSMGLPDKLGIAGSFL